MTAWLHIERASRGFVDCFRAYEVIVDGELRDEIRFGEKRTIEVDSGQVEVFMRIDWCRSRIVRMSLEPGSEQRRFCRPRSLLTAFHGFTLGRENYIQVEELLS